MTMEWKTLALATLSLGCFVGAAHADQLADIKKKGEIICGTLGTDEPDSFVDPKTRNIIGYDVDLCNAVAKKLGVKMTLKQISVAARIPELQQGRVDLLSASLTQTPARAEVIDFSITTFVTPQKVMVRRDSGITTLAQLAGKKVSAVKGGTQEPNIRKVVPTVDVVNFETAPQAWVALQQRKTSGVINEQGSLLDSQAKIDPDKKIYVLLAEDVATEELALGIRKGEAAMKTLVDETLLELERSGEAEKIFFKWYGPASKVKYQTRNFKFQMNDQRVLLN